MLGLIIILAIAYNCARGIENGMGEVSKQHKKRTAKAAKKNGRKMGAKLAAGAATGATAIGSFCKGFKRGWKREWPKARKRAAEKFGRREPQPAIGDDIGSDGAPGRPVTPRAVDHGTPVPAATPPPVTTPAPTGPAPHTHSPAKKPADPSKADPDERKLAPVTHLPTAKKQPTQGETPMALAQIQEITGVDTLKAFAARTASEANVTAEEAGAIAQRAAQELAAIEAAIEQATALEFDDDGGTIPELSAMRDQAMAALTAANALQAAEVDKAALASQTSKNIHDRHTNIQEAVSAQGGRMAKKEAYTADA